MNGKEINDKKGKLPVEQNNPEERQPNPVEAEKAVNPDLDEVEEEKPA
jgi:hypothetical protein